MGRLLSRFGVGAAEVDTVLEEGPLQVGDRARLRVDITGGDASQRVKAVDFRLFAELPKLDGTDTKTVAIDHSRAAESFTIEPEETRTLSAPMVIPDGTPITWGETLVRLETALSVGWAIDPTAREQVEVEPEERFNSVHDGMDELGFVFIGTSEAELEAIGELDLSARGAKVAADRPVLQRFRYKARSGPFAGRIEEVHLVPVPTPKRLYLVVAVDRHTDVVSDSYRPDVTGEWIRVEETSVPRVRKELRSLIEGRT